MAGEQELVSLPDFEKVTKERELERKQRLREYRVAARREKRNRKADEKKQRKLNATILRRMTRNPDKYNKNAERNRLRDIQIERQRIWTEALRQAERLAAIHDPSGAIFNVSPVVRQDDGTVVHVETLRKRQEREAIKHANVNEGQDRVDNTNRVDRSNPEPAAQSYAVPISAHGLVNQDRLGQMNIARAREVSNSMSKTQQKKLAALEPRPPPPKPVIPESFSIPDGEVDWLSLWDLSDDQLEKRVLKEKRRKAAERKALRLKQKSGKAERREARDEKRKVYRDTKLIWKAIKEEQTKHKTKLKSLEDEESKKIAVEVNVLERKMALEHSAHLGFTLANTPGVDEIKPRALGMKGVEVDFNALEAGNSRSTVKPKNTKKVDLSRMPQDTGVELITANKRVSNTEGVDEFIGLDIGEGQDHETLNYNHKLRRKLRRAIDNAEVQKEVLVRKRAADFYLSKNMQPPPELKTPLKPVNVKGQRVLENGTLETAKQERVRTRMELAEYNKAARVLRKQAKQSAMEAGLRKHAELIGKLPSTASAIDLTANADSDAPDGSAIMSTIMCSSQQVRNRSPCVNSEFVPAMPENGRLVKKRKREKEESSNNPGSSGDSSTSDNAIDISEGKQEIMPKPRMSAMVHNQRQAMIDAEALVIETAKKRKDAKQESQISLQEVDANAHCRFRMHKKGKNGHLNRRCDELLGDENRKSKFLRFLGAGKSRTSNKPGYLNEGAEHTATSYPPSGVSVTDVEKQCERSMVQSQYSKRKGLGA